MNSSQNPSDPEKQLLQLLDVDFALQAMGLGLWEFNTTTNQVILDDTCRQLLGLAEGNELPYEQAIQYIHPQDVEQVRQAVVWALNPLSDGHYDQTYRTIGADDGQLRWVRFYGKSYFTPTGELARFAGIAQEITQQVVARKMAEESEARLRAIIEQAPVAMNISKGPTHIIELANERMFALWGKEPQTVLNKPTFEAFPEAVGQGFESILDHVYNTGETYRVNEMPATLSRQGVLETIYLNLVYEPFRDENGTITGLMQVAIEVTEQVLARQEKAEAEARLQTIITHLPSATVVFKGRELVVESPSKNFIDIIDRGPDVAGKPLGELMPELESQSYLAILDNVYTSGQPFRAFGTPVDIRQADGSVTRDFFDLIYTPLLNSQGQSYAILSVATNVTDIIRTHQQLRESEERYRAIVDLAEIGIYTIDLTTNQLIKSPRVADWYGLPELTDVATSISVIEESDQARVSQTLTDAIRDKSKGYYDLEYGVTSARTGQKRILRTTGQLIYNPDGQPVCINGSVLDITSQRALQVALQQEVQQRTEELAAVNQELAATNEELSANNEQYVVINEALEEANNLLTRSNDNLQTFAYVASHDLQEPLRKIQQFGDLLKTHYADSIGAELVYAERMQSAARRMSTLIKDLLDFSRISTQRDVSGPVSLQTIVENVVSTLELRVEELAARIQVGLLPTVAGDESQLSQLFQNLLSNALKFHRTDQAGVPVAPLIEIDARLLAANQLPPGIKPGRTSTAYHQITVTDNGIGFDEKYLDRIFQVFQRLHNKSAFAGTGIGLAICEKVVANHGGAITASSQPGEGATFTVYLPA